ncbi:TolC family protein, partial [Paraburkholderia tropica]|uniref:TolC family protein n=1 Tax=Paraburkholderia tropica TaxID=92647 RepID=UPI001CC49A29
VSSIRSADKQLVDAQHALDASTKAYQLAVIRYKAGLSEQLQVLNADQNRLAAEQTVTNLKSQRADEQMALIKALGGGFDAQNAGLVPPAQVGSEAKGTNSGQSDVNGSPWRDAPWSASASSASATSAHAAAATN